MWKILREKYLKVFRFLNLTKTIIVQKNVFTVKTTTYMYDICSLQVCVYKPATSKSGNSEVYVVCLNFHGLQERKEEFIKFCKPFFGKFKHSNNWHMPTIICKHISFISLLIDSSWIDREWNLRVSIPRELSASWFCVWTHQNVWGVYWQTDGHYKG